jgi:hypothetical protein
MLFHTFTNFGGQSVLGNLSWSASGSPGEGRLALAASLDIWLVSKLIDLVEIRDLFERLLRM